MLFDFALVEDRKVVASFDDGAIITGASALLLGASHTMLGRAAGCSAASSTIMIPA